MTTDSRHTLPIYPNLADKMLPKALNQLWVADITYIRLPVELVYLAVVLDAFSRRVIGWALGRTAASRAGGGCAGNGASRTKAATWTRPSLGSRRAIRFAGVHGDAEMPQSPNQHAPQR